MDKDKQIQKIDKLSLKKLSEDSSLVKRGLRDLSIWPKIQTLLKEIEKQYYFEKKYNRCIELCDEVLKTEPLALLPLCYKAFSYSKLAQHQEALVWYDKALQTELSFEETPSEQKLEKEGETEKDHFKIDFELLIGKKAYSLLNLERYDEAVDALNQALKKFPNNYINLQNKAFCLEKLGKTNEALGNHEKSLLLQPFNDKYYDFKGSIDNYFNLAYNNDENDFLTRVDNFFNLGEREISSLLWGKFLKENQKNIEILLQKARDFYKQKNYNQAIDIFSACLKEKDNEFYIW